MSYEDTLKKASEAILQGDTDPQRVLKALMRAFPDNSSSDIVSAFVHGEFLSDCECRPFRISDAVKYLAEVNA